jgi:2-C-methyl-D-erythritol 2,4-cyclodiphosphate synthase
MNLLTRVKKLLDNRGAKIVNVDATVVLQKPKLSPYMEKMKENIAFALCCDASDINIKATTEERLGFTGREEGVSSHAVCLIEFL